MTNTAISKNRKMRQESKVLPIRGSLLLLLSLFFAKIKDSKEDDNFWLKNNLIFISSIIETAMKQKF